MTRDELVENMNQALEVLATLPDDVECCKNEHGNISVWRRGVYMGYVAPVVFETSIVPATPVGCE